MEGKQVGVAELKQALATDFDRLVEEMAAAMNAAKAGHVIADTEEVVRDAHAQFRERAYAQAIRLLQSQQEASSPRPAGLQNKGQQPTTHLTVNGRLSVCRTVYWSAQSGTVIPTDQWLGLTEHRVSPGVREMCCREALHCSFEVAGDNLQRTAQLSLAGRSLREVVENQGRAVLTAQQKGLLLPAFTVAECTAQTVITGADGVMVPLVTEEQKQKRRQTESAKRTEQGRPSTAPVGRPTLGSDGPYKEFKLLAFYDPDKSHCHVVATSGNHEALGRLMRREARRLHLAQAKVKYALSDGAEWIAHQYGRQLPMLDEHILDYRHLRDHVVEASHVLYGEGTKQAVQWREEMMGCVWEHGSLVLLDRLGSYLRRHRTGVQHEALESLRDFVAKRVAMTDYPRFRQLGYDCGSGPTESLCGTLTDRLKGPGMRWDKSNAEAMMALACVCHSGLWDTYWKSERAAA